MRRAYRWRHRGSGSRGVAQIISVILMVTLTVVLMGIIYAIRLPYPSSPPSITYSAVNNVKYPAWGDPTDCYPNLPYLPNDWKYYLWGGENNTSDRALWTEYMNDWNTQCEDEGTGIYNPMNATGLIITGVSQPIPLSGIEFEFICTNTTTTKGVTTTSTTYLVKGMLDDMEWVPGGGGSQNLSSSAPTLGTCGTYNPEGSGANSVYYNRLGFFDPLNEALTTLQPGMTLVLYVHTPDSIFEAPSDLFEECRGGGTTCTCPWSSSCDWGKPDTDDYHGAPLWCFTVPGSCTVELLDTALTQPVVFLSVPVYLLG